MAELAASVATDLGQEVGRLERIDMSELKAVTCKRRDAWWTVLLVDPIAMPLVRWAIPRAWITPNRVTAAAFVVGLASAACFARATAWWLVAGAVLYHVAFVLDCVDGKLARWQGSGSIFGAWMDYALDRVRMFICTVALMGGQYAATRNAIYLYLGLGVVFLDLFRQLNSLQFFRLRTSMRRDLDAAFEASAGPAPAEGEPTRRTAFLDEIASRTGRVDDDIDPPLDLLDVDDDVQVVDIQREFRQRHRRFWRLRVWLARYRIRPHLVSGIEFQMAVLIVAPITGQLVVVPVVTGVALLVFELALIYKFLLSTRDFNRSFAALTGARVPPVRGQATLGTPAPAGRVSASATAAATAASAAASAEPGAMPRPR